MSVLLTAALWAAWGLSAVPAVGTAAAPRLPDPRLGHVSAFRSGVLLTLDETPVDWRKSQELVRSLAGHAGHLRSDPTEAPDTRGRKAQP